MQLAHRRLLSRGPPAATASRPESDDGRPVSLARALLASCLALRRPRRDLVDAARLGFPPRRQASRRTSCACSCSLVHCTGSTSTGAPIYTAACHVFVLYMLRPIFYASSVVSPCELPSLLSASTNPNSVTSSCVDWHFSFPFFY